MRRTRIRESANASSSCAVDDDDEDVGWTTSGLGELAQPVSFPPHAIDPTHVPDQRSRGSHPTRVARGRGTRGRRDAPRARRVHQASSLPGARSGRAPAPAPAPLPASAHKKSKARGTGVASGRGLSTRGGGGARADGPDAGRLTHGQLGQIAELALDVLPLRGLSLRPAIRHRACATSRGPCRGRAWPRAQCSAWESSRSLVLRGDRSHAHRSRARCRRRGARERVAGKTHSRRS